MIEYLIEYLKFALVYYKGIGMSPAVSGASALPVLNTTLNTILNTTAGLRSLLSAGSEMSEVPGCQTQRLLNNAVVDHRSSIQARTIGDFGIESAGMHACVSAAVKDKQDWTGKTGQSSGLATAEPSGYVKNRYVCNICGFIGARASRLQDHMIKHDEHPALSCEECGNTFKFKRCLIRHQKVLHNKACNFVCCTCMRRFSADTDLQKHVDSAHGTNKAFKCTQCPMTYNCKASLKRHMTGHYGGFQMKCFVCSAVFTDNTKLNRHVHRRHKGQCKCTFCNNDTRQSSCLLRPHVEVRHDQRIKTKSMATDEHQPSTSNTCVNKSQIQKEHEETIRLLHELQDTFLDVSSQESGAFSCDNFFPG